MSEQHKRLFLGLEVQAPWPSEFPAGGRILEDSCRHVTLAFLGQTDYKKMEHALAHFVPPPFKVGLIGNFNHCLFLPKRHPSVVAWQVNWMSKQHIIQSYQKELVYWLRNEGFSVDQREDFLPHVTICRHPEHQKEWMSQFTPLPMMTKDLHLYESLGHSSYRSCWKYALKPPFEEMEHTADIAFRVYGETLMEIYQHAYMALAFTFPPILSYPLEQDGIDHLDDVVIHLNTIVSKVDESQGCPFKAVSFHGDVIEKEPGLLMWEMIVDV